MELGHTPTPPPPPIYFGGRDQEDHSSKPALGKQFLRPYLKKNKNKKKLHTQKGWQSGLNRSKCEALSSNPSATKNKMFKFLCVHSALS
jgi:hypothetical protein